VLPPGAPLLDAHPDRPVGVRPGAQLALGLGDVRQVAEDVDQALAPRDAEVRSRRVGDVVVEVDQM
jgi:hypothetical protein